MDQHVFEILRAYPQVYLACHVEHRTRGASPTGLTERDGSVLAHIDDREGTRPAELARHLGIARSTLSATLARLEQAGLLDIDADASDRRRRRIRLTEHGRAAIASHSVLDPERLAALLARLAPAERIQAVEGMRLLAGAARRYREAQGRC